MYDWLLTGHQGAAGLQAIQHHWAPYVREPQARHFSG
jgi:hypothetical protein